jgi:hypothetical protein
MLIPGAGLVFIADAGTTQDLLNSQLRIEGFGPVE